MFNPETILDMDLETLIQKVSFQTKEQRQELLNYILENPTEFQRLVKSRNDLINFAKAFPEQSQVLFDLFLGDPIEYKKLINDCHELQCIAEAFPEQCQALFDLSLGNPIEYQRLMKSRYSIDSILDLKYFAEAFPGQRQAVFDLFLGNPTKYEKWAPPPHAHVGMIKALSEIFPEQRQVMFNFFLRNSTFFTAFLNKDRTSYILKSYTEAFPEEAELFKQRDTRDILIYIQEQKEKENAIIVQNVAFLYRSRFFGNLNKDVKIGIAILISFNKYTTYEEAINHAVNASKRHENIYAKIEEQHKISPIIDPYKISSYLHSMCPRMWQTEKKRHDNQKVVDSVELFGNSYKLV